jgi:hypothetical protein
LKKKMGDPEKMAPLPGNIKLISTHKISLLKFVKPSL